MNAWVLLLIAIIGEVIATTNLKLSNGFTKLLPSLIVVLGYGISFYCLSLTLKTIPLGIAYAVWSALGIVLVSLFAFLVFGQKLDFWAILGMLFITIGVLIINLLSQSGSH